MKKDSKEAMRAAATLAAEYNPYMSKAIVYMIGSEKRYIYGDTSYTAAELNKAYEQTAAHDYANGYNERMTGYYDKWYRYSHADEGRAYDAGVRAATMNDTCPMEFHIIECAH